MTRDNKRLVATGVTLTVLAVSVAVLVGVPMMLLIAAGAVSGFVTAQVVVNNWIDKEQV